MNTIIEDEKGREIIKISDKGRIAIARFPDMSEQTKEYIVSLYKDVSSGDIIELMDFLEYKSEKNEFCV